MNRFLILTIGSIVSFNAFADQVDFAQLSQALVSTSDKITEMKLTCGSNLENVTSSILREGITEFKFNLVSRGAGRLGNRVFAKCEVRITVDTNPTRADGFIIYSAEYLQTQGARTKSLPEGRSTGGVELNTI